jgi:hypothetical protein
VEGGRPSSERFNTTTRRHWQWRCCPPPSCTIYLCHVGAPSICVPRWAHRLQVGYPSRNSCAHNKQAALAMAVLSSSFLPVRLALGWLFSTNNLFGMLRRASPQGVYMYVPWIYIYKKMYIYVYMHIYMYSNLSKGRLFPRNDLFGMLRHASPRGKLPLQLTG